MARHTSLWISVPIWSTGAMRSCHRSRPDRRTLSLFCSDWGLKNRNTTWKAKNHKRDYQSIHEKIPSVIRLSETNLENHQDAADDAGVSIHHGPLHDVTDAAEVTGLDGVLFAQQGTQRQAVAASCQQVELVDAHSTYMMKQLIDHVASSHSFLCEKTWCTNDEVSAFIE